MRTRFRTLLLAGAASLAVSGALAQQVTLDGIPATKQGVMKITCSDANNSAASPCFVSLSGSNQITANQGAPAAQTQANAWPVLAYQGTTPWSISGPVTATLNQGGAALSTSNPIFAQVTNFPATQAISAASLPLPTDAATAANQTSEIAQLTAANQRTSYFGDIGPGTLAASTTATNPVRDAGATPSAFTKFNASFASSVAVTAIVQASNDNASFFDLYTATTTAPATGAGYNTLTVSLPITYRYYRTKVISGSTAASVYVTSSLTVN